MRKRVVKSASHTESYQRHKLRASLQAACMSVREAVGSAEITAEKVCEHVEDWLGDKDEVTSLDVRLNAAGFLKKYNQSAAYAYEKCIDIN